MNKMLKLVVLSLVGLSTLLAGCLPSRIWADDSFPDRALVFIVRGELEDELGFISPDGTGLVTRALNRGVYISPSTWGPDGKLIAFRAEPAGESYFDTRRAQVLTEDGYLYDTCREWRWHFGRVQVTSEGELLMSALLEDVNYDQIVLADFRTCQILSTLFKAQLDWGDEMLESPTLSTQGELALGQILRSESIMVETNVLVVDPVTGKTRIIGHGLAPDWSPDGEWIAYTAFDGIYVVRRDGSDPRRVVSIDSTSSSRLLGWSTELPAAAWSPDGTYLAYHRITADGPAIYKVNVGTGEEALIYQGGLYPDWR